MVHKLFLWNFIACNVPSNESALFNVKRAAQSLMVVWNVYLNSLTDILIQFFFLSLARLFFFLQQIKAFRLRNNREKINRETERIASIKRVTHEHHNSCICATIERNLINPFRSIVGNAIGIEFDDKRAELS